MSARINLFAAIVVATLSLASAQAQDQPAASADQSSSLSSRLSRLGRTLFQRPEPESAEKMPGRNRPANPGMAVAPSNRAPANQAARQPTTQHLRPNPTANPSANPGTSSTAGGSSRRTAQPSYARGTQTTPSARTETPQVAQRPSRTTANTEADTSQSLETTEPETGAGSEPEATADSTSEPESPIATATETPVASETPVETEAPAAGTDRPTSLQNRLRAARRMATGAESTGANTQDTSTARRSADTAPPAAKKSASATETEKPKHEAVAEKAAEATEPVIERGPLLSHDSPVLHLETAGPQKIKVGMPAVYTVKLMNSGRCEATDVVVSVKVPEGADIANTEASEGAAQAGSSADGASTLEWKIPRLAANGRAELSIRMIPRKNRPFDLAVQWTHAPVVSQTQVEVQEAKLLMNLSGPNEVFYGEREVFKLTLSNPGNGDAEHVVVRLMPTTPGDGQAVSHEIGLIRAGENKVVELELTARQVGTLRMKAEATADSGLQASVDEEIVVRRADLKVVVAGPELLYAGTTGTFQVQVTNPGTAMAKNVQISAMLPAGSTYVSSTEGGSFSQDQARIAWSTTNLRPGGEWTCTFTCQLANPGANSTQVVSSADGDLRNTASCNTVVEALADLTLEVKDPQGPVPVGQDTWYEVQVRNRGTKAAEGVEIFAFFSPGIEPLAVEGGPHEISPGQIALAPIASLGPGQQAMFKIKARADQPGNHIFRAEVQCSTLDTKLAAEETTRFYGTSSAAPVTPAAESAEADASNTEVEPSDTEPAPIDASEEPAEATP